MGGCSTVYEYWSRLLASLLKRFDAPLSLEKVASAPFSPLLSPSSRSGDGHTRSAPPPRGYDVRSGRRRAHGLAGEGVGCDSPEGKREGGESGGSA